MNIQQTRPAKNIIFDLGHVIFHYDPQFVDELFETAPEKVFSVIPAGVEILRSCRAQITPDGSPLHTLFVLSNATDRSFKLMNRLCPEVFSYFDHIMISEHVGMQKPDIRIYQHFLTTHSLDPAECIFIDDKEANVAVARHAGITSILFDNPARVTVELAKLGIF